MIPSATEHLVFTNRIDERLTVVRSVERGLEPVDQPSAWRHHAYNQT